jgi:hypothetical protein
VISAVAKYSTLALAEPWLVAFSTPGSVSRSLVPLNNSHSILGGKSGTIPGLATGAVMCGLFQWAFNEFDILRITHVSQVVHTQPVSVIPAAPVPIHSLPAAALEPPRTLTDRIFAVFGHRISDEEYLNRVKAQRDHHLRRIEQLERERGEKCET